MHHILQKLLMPILVCSKADHRRHDHCLLVLPGSGHRRYSLPRLNTLTNRCSASLPTPCTPFSCPSLHGRPPLTLPCHCFGGTGLPKTTRCQTYLAPNSITPQARKSTMAHTQTRTLHPVELIHSNPRTAATCTKSSIKGTPLP
jgi:hypothetical protein